MPTQGDRVRVAVGVGPTGLLSEPPTTGRVVTVGGGLMTVLWENGVVSDNLPVGVGLVDVLTDPPDAAVARLYPQLVRQRGQRGAAQMAGYVAGLYASTRDTPGALPSTRVLVRTLGGTYCEWKEEDVETVPGYISDRPIIQ